MATPDNCDPHPDRISPLAMAIHAHEDVGMPPGAGQ